MLCACSREQELHLEETPESPESLATRDFSVSGLSSRTAGDCDLKIDDSQVDDIESTLRETLSLNYEEARALLGRLEYQRGNFDAALQVFEGIDIRGLKLRMVKAIVERSHPRKARSKRGNLTVNVMSMHSVSLLLEAILLKSKSLEGLGRVKDAAMECKTVLDIVESAWPHGMPQRAADSCKLEEILHKALELLPELCKQTGHLDEAVSAYRRALIKPWNLDPKKCTNFQKELAVILLYGGEEVTLTPQLQLAWGSRAPKTNIDEAMLLLLILMRRILFQEIRWDPEIMNHLSFALSVSGQFELLAHHFEQLLPGVYSRTERWHFLALCYSAAGMDDIAVNVLRNSLISSKQYHKPHMPSLLLGLKICSRNKVLASEGLMFAERVVQCASDQGKHFFGLTCHLSGICYGNLAWSAISDPERLKLQKAALEAIQKASALEKDDPEVIYNLAEEFGVQRKFNAAKEFAVKYLDLVGGSSLKGWRLLALTVSAEHGPGEVESVVDLAIDHTGIVDQLELLQMKGLVHASFGQTKNALEMYRSLLALVQACKTIQIGATDPVFETHTNLEVETWNDLALMYAKLGSQTNSSSCMDIAKSMGYFSPKTWHTTGVISETENESLAAFFTSLSIEPDHVPSLVSAGVVLRKAGGISLPIARSFLMSALKMEPTNQEAWYNLGLVFNMEGSIREAADCFQEASKLQDSSPILNIR